MGSIAMDDIVIVSAARTPVGSFNGAFATVPAHQLGVVAIKAALERAGVAAEDIDEVILGQVLTAGQGQNPARQAAILAGMPEGRTAFGINQVCGSGLRAVALAAQQIQTGQSNIVIAGGQESMSLSTHCAYLRAGTKMGDLGLVDTMIKDGLWDAFNGYHMGTTAENVATAFQITRQQQDEFAASSQQKASTAQRSGRFTDEIAPVTVKGRKGDVVVSDDEYIRHDSTVEGMAMKAGWTSCVGSTGAPATVQTPSAVAFSPYHSPRQARATGPGRGTPSFSQSSIATKSRAASPVWSNCPKRRYLAGI
jgi:acetyl-CoA C-acetyltransferase